MYLYLYIAGAVVNRNIRVGLDRERGSVLILSQERIQTATPVCLFEAALARRPFITLTYFTDKYTHYYTYFVVICVFYLAHTHTKSVNVC